MATSSNAVMAGRGGLKEGFLGYLDRYVEKIKVLLKVEVQFYITPKLYIMK